jgi:hypothetical protein
LGEKRLVRPINYSVLIFLILNSIKAQSYATIYRLASFTRTIARAKAGMSSQPTTCSAYIPTEISVQLYLSKLQPAELSQLRDFRRNGSGNVAVLAKVPLGINARSVYGPSQLPSHSL